MTHLFKKLEVIEAAAKEATPGPRTKYNDNEGHGQSPLWCVKNSAYDDEENDFNNAFEVTVYCGCERDADFIALANPATILQLTQALRTAMPVLIKSSKLKCDCEWEHHDGEDERVMICASCKAKEALAEINALYAEGGK